MNSNYLLSVSRYSEFPPSTMMSPSDRFGSSFSMKPSTAIPALTNRIMRRGFLIFATNSSTVRAPITFVSVGFREIIHWNPA